MLITGTLKGFNAGTYKAIVKLSGSNVIFMHDVSVARNIAAIEMVTDRECCVYFPHGLSNPGNAVVIAVWT